MISPLTEQILQYAIPIGCGLGAFCFAIVLRMGQFLKKQTTNGDGRTLRRALDDLCVDFAEHRHEIRHHLQKLGDEFMDHTIKDDLRFEELNLKLDGLKVKSSTPEN